MREQLAKLFRGYDLAKAFNYILKLTRPNGKISDTGGFPGSSFQIDIGCNTA